MKNIWHVGGWSINYGDRVLQKATTQIIKECFGDDINITYVDVQRTLFSEQLIKKINKEADLLFFGGGGFMFPPAKENKSGWQLNIETKNINKIKVPMISYGLGFNKFPHDNVAFSDYTVENIETFINKNVLFSVRNSGTLNAIKNMGVGVDNCHVVPDAGMFVKSDKFDHKVFDNDNIKIGINWATDRAALRFGSEKNYIDAARKFFTQIKEIQKKYDASIYLIEHLFRLDTNSKSKDIIHKLISDVFEKNYYILYNILETELYPPFDYTAGFFADIYKKMDFVFGMRGHSAIVSFGMKTPFIGIGQHNKVKWFLQEVGSEQNLIRLDNDIDKISCFFDEFYLNRDKIINKNKKMFAKMSDIKNEFVKLCSKNI